jgi:hypothetical protein
LLLLKDTATGIHFHVNGCGTWSLTLRDEHRLRVFGNRVLRRIFGPKREEVAGDWRRLHNEELHNLYTSPNIIFLKRHLQSFAGLWPTLMGFSIYI